MPNTFNVADPESAAFDTPVTVTLSVPSGHGTLDIGATGAQASLTPSGGQAVTISGDNTRLITLTGRAADIKALLNGRNFDNNANDATGGLYYTSPTDGNHDYNVAEAGDVTLTLSLADTGSRFGGDVGSGSVAANPADIVIPITITPVNDAPTVAAVSTTVSIAATTAVSGFVISDVDNTDGGLLIATAGETDLMQATIRLLPAVAVGDTPLPASGDAGGIDHTNVVFSSSSVGGATVDATYTGTNKALVIRGTVAQVNTYLSGLQVNLSGNFLNNNTFYRVQVVADDRLRDAAGALDGSHAANGGLNTDGTTGTANVPVTALDPYAAIPGGLTYNVAANTRQILGSNANEAPSFAALDNTPSFAENGAAVVLDTNATLSDPELTAYSNWDQAVLTLARNGGANGDDVFTLTGSGSTGINFNGADIRNATTIVGTCTNAGGTLAITFNASATNAVVNSVLQAITYSNSNNNPPASVTINYIISDGDTDPDRAGNGQGAGGVRTGPGSITVGITPTNDTPTLTGISAKGYTEDGSAVVIGSGATPGDPELSILALGAGQWGNANLVLSRSGGAQAEDVFGASGTLGVGIYLDAGNVLKLDGAAIGTYANGAGTLTLTFNDNVTTAKVQSALQGITYSNTRQSLAAGATTGITLDWVLHDGDTDPDRVSNGQGTGGDKSVTVSQTITLTGANDTPTITTGSTTATGAITEILGAKASAVADTASGSIAFADVDLTDTHTNTVAAPTFAWSGGALSGAQQAALSGAITFTLGAKVDGTSGTQAWSFSAADTNFDFLAKNETLTSTHAVTINDGHGGTVAKDVVITITGTNDAPVLLTTTSITTNEDITSTAYALSALLTASDVDSVSSLKGLAIIGNTANSASEGVWQYSSNGTDWKAVGTVADDATALALSASTQVRFVPYANYHGTPAGLTVRALDDTYAGSFTTYVGATETRVTVNPSSNGGSTAVSANTKIIGITVIPFNDAPTIGNLDAFSVNATNASPYLPGGSAIVIDPNVAFTDQELSVELNSPNGNWNGATLSISRQGGASVEDELGASGSLDLAAGNVLKSGATTIGSYAYSNTKGTLAFTFNANATTALVNSAVQGITYRNTNPAPTYPSVTLAYTLNDQNPNVTGGGTAGTGQDQGGGGKLLASANIQIFMNHPPVANNDTVTISEGISTTSNSSMSGNVIGTNPHIAAAGDTAGQDSDADSDTMTVQGVIAGDQHLSTLSNANVGTTISGNYGSINIAANGAYSYVLNNTLPGIQALAVGEHPPLAEIFTYTINDGKGGKSTATVTVAITGTNDVPLVSDTVVSGTVVEQITPNGDLTSSGALTFSDVDLSDVHTITTAPIGSPLGTLTVMKNSDTTGSGTGGQLTWNYTVPDSAVEYLAAGETKVEQFTVTVDDGHGGVVNRTISITIVGTNDVPLVSDTVVTGSVTEQITPSGNLTSSGALTFTDVDLSDVHTITTVPIGSPLGTLTTVKNSDTTGSGTGGQLTWNYAVADSAVEYLATGETKVEQFTVTVNDGHGGVVNRIVTITINGTNDAPVMSDTVVTGTVTEQITPDGNLTSSGAITFTDVDLSDAHTITAAPIGSPLGTLTAAKSTDTTGSGTGGQLTWNYTVADSAVEYLAAGETKVEQFTVTVDDGHGGVVNRIVTITINGTNDVPLVSDTVVTGTVTEQITPNGNLTSSGALTFADVDLSDVHTITAAPIGSPLGTLTTVKNSDTTGSGNGGQLTWNYTVPDSAVEYLATGETKVEQFTVKVDDGHGGVVNRIVTITIIGTNDVPLVSDTVVTGSVTEQPGSTADLTSSGALTFTDVDLSDTHTITAAPLGTTLGTLTAVKNSDTTGSGTGGQLTWTYTVANSAVEYLAAGESKIEQFTVTVDDGHGGVVNRIVTITINGTNPVVALEPSPPAPAPVPTQPVTEAPPQPLTETPITVQPVIETPEPILPAAPATSVPPVDAAVVVAPGVNTPPPAKTSGANILIGITDLNKVDDAGRINLRSSIPGLQSSPASGDTNADSRKLESTDRGFPVERLQVEAAKVNVTQDQQKGGDRLFVYNGIKNTATEVGQSLDYRVPRDAFGHTNTAAIVQLEVSLSDGSPLPEWLDFDPTSGTFSGKPPANAAGNLEVKVTARDDQGRETSANFKMQVEGNHAQTPSEKPLPGPGADAGEQDMPGGTPARLAAEKPVKRGTIPFSDQLKLSKRDPLMERILSRQQTAARATTARHLAG